MLVDLLSLDYGLLRAVARGVRGHNSRKRTVMQAFQPLLVSLSGRGELLGLNQAEHAAPGFRLAGDRLFSAMYLNELLMRLLQAQEAQPAIYQLYQQALIRLQQGGPLQASLRRFEFSLLQELGYGWDLHCDALSGALLQANLCYLFDPEHGYEEVQAPTGPRPPGLFTGEELLAFSSDMENDEAVDRELGDVDVVSMARQNTAQNAAKRLMRQALQPHLGSKPLLSRTLFAVKTDSVRAADHGGSGRVLPPEDNTG